MADRIGFVGTGRMGGGMATRLLQAGFAVTVYDVDAAVLTPLREAGAQVAASPRAVADAAEIVFASLPSPKVSRAVAAEIAQGKATKVYVETSTIGTDTMAALQAALAGTGIALVDAPVSGGPPGAYAGTLSTVVAGPAAAVARIRPALESFAKHVFVLGTEPGQAQIAKLINNLLSLAGRVIAFEGQALGMKVGIDPVVLNDFINVSTGRNMATLDDFPSRLLHIFRSGGKTSIGVKDTELFIAEA
ncbi:MAG TPA: NAD(P)-dependent oxidoreductase, partial [Hyphomicrobiales bacterium]|nr:NAD(P)-dependent oxidoreductase [Hyphomicrobiales bacterium]